MTNDSPMGICDYAAMLVVLALVGVFLGYIIFPALAQMVTVDSLPLTGHADRIRPQGVNATLISAWIAIGLCNPKPYLCEDETIKVVCTFAGTDGRTWLNLLVISTRGLPLDKIISGEVGPAIVTGIPARTQNYIDNTLRNNNCTPIDLPWMGAN